MPIEPIQAKLLEAYRFAKKAHEGMVRKDGTPFMEHPIRVAFRVVATEANTFHSLPMLDCMIVALLHDVIEDTDHTKETLIGAGFGKWANDVYVLSRRAPQECEFCAPQWDTTHMVSDRCRLEKGEAACQSHWEYIVAVRDYAILNSYDHERKKNDDWRFDTVIRVKRADIEDNMVTSDRFGPGMLPRYEESLRILLTEGAERER